jgi:hypothetical protein
MVGSGHAVASTNQPCVRTCNARIPPPPAAGSTVSDMERSCTTIPQPSFANKPSLVQGGSRANFAHRQGGVLFAGLRVRMGVVTGDVPTGTQIKSSALYQLGKGAPHELALPLCTRVPRCSSMQRVGLCT